jgi:hypothetical protein
MHCCRITATQVAHATAASKCICTRLIAPWLLLLLLLILLILSTCRCCCC